MGFRNGAFAKVWKIEHGTRADGSVGNYSVCNLTVSRKNKQTDKYEKEFQDGFVRFVGDAHNKIQGKEIPNNGLTIKIGGCDVTNRYNQQTKKTYVNYIVFDFEFPDNSQQNNTKTKHDIFAEIDDETPF